MFLTVLLSVLLFIIVGFLLAYYFIVLDDLSTKGSTRVAESFS